MPIDFWYFVIIPCVVVFGILIKIVGSAVAEEGMEQFRRWRGRYPGLANRKQSVSVQYCASMLVSKRRRVRMEAAEMMALLDRTAVPPLLKALERFPDDAPFVERVIQTLEILRDSRALPALNRYSVNHNLSLMKAARRACTAIELQHTLLRAATAPIPATRSLLRPAAHGVGCFPEELVRPDLTDPKK